MAKKVLNGNKDGNGFDKNPQNINRKGSPGKSITKCLKELLDSNLVELELVQTKADGTKKTVKINVEARDGMNKALSVILLRKALDGDLQAIKEIFDRTEGKATQPIELEDNRKAIQSLFPDIDETDKP